MVPYPVLPTVSSCYPKLKGRSSTRYSPVRHSVIGASSNASFDLHVLGTPPAFNLSQNQTLQLKYKPSEDSYYQTYRVRPIARSNLTESLSSQLTICLSKNHPGSFRIPPEPAKGVMHFLLPLVNTFLRKTFLFFAEPEYRHRQPDSRQPGRVCLAR
ncbi:MAG: hypothetical protein DELT_00674 [Desulfovibrio sp.]